jgi:hypothetical protein
MRFDVYCDEAYPDLFASRSPRARYLVIGSLWMRAEDRVELKARLQTLRNLHRMGAEFKWRKVSPSKLGFYVAVIDAFFALGDRVRFRCIAVDSKQVDLVRYHESDQELGFYKFYYQLLHNWILDFNEYSIYCDEKPDRLPDRLATLRRCLAFSNLSSEIIRVQPICSWRSLPLQVADVLTGAAAARLNGKLVQPSAKQQLVAHLEERLRRPVAPTDKGEQKFNVFAIDLGGGW